MEQAELLHVKDGENELLTRSGVLLHVNGALHCGGARGHLGFPTSCASIFTVLVSFLP